MTTATQDAVDDAIRFLTVRAEGDGWVGDAPAWFGDHLFGGVLIAQAVHAVTRTAPAGKRLHSLHTYFLRPARTGRPLVYRTTVLRDGRTFSTRSLVAKQDGEAVLTMTCSFSADTDGYEYELPVGRDAPGPDDLPHVQTPGPWIAAQVGPTPPRADGTRESTHRHWFRIPTTLPDDPHLHTALVAYATDWTGVGGRPLHLEGDITGMLSLDHAVWFHRPVRADAWLLHDVHSLINTGGRGVLRSTIHDVDRRIMVSMAQEMRLRPAGR